MGNESSQRQTAAIIAAVTLSNHKILSAGEAFVLEAKDEEEQQKLTLEIAKTIKGDVTQLSNGIYLILRS